VPALGNSTFSEVAIDRLADQLWARIVGANCNPVEINLRAKLALEHCLLGSDVPPFGLDKLATEETAAYIDVKPDTLRDKKKRLILGIPAPYKYGRKLFWRRSELDQWIEQQRPAQREVGKSTGQTPGRRNPECPRTTVGTAQAKHGRM
jgi:hypothetical protein